jgi:response regulator of citrate/malate metabolism
MLDESVNKNIMKTLKKSDCSLTIDEVAKRAKIHRVTASKYLAVLEAIGTVKMREVGKAKLFLLRGRNEK